MTDLLDPVSPSSPVAPARRIALSWALRHSAAAVAEGYSAERILGDCGLPIAVDPKAEVVTPNQFALLCINLILLLEDESQGAARRRTPVGAVSLAVRVMLAEATLAQGLDAYFRFFHALCPGFHWAMRTDGEVTTIALSIDGRRGSSSSSGEEILVAAIHMYMSWYAGRPVPVMEAVTSAPDHPAIGRSPSLFLGAPVRLDRFTGMRFPSRCLAWKRRARLVEQPVRESVKFAMDWMWNSDPVLPSSLEDESAPRSRAVLGLLEEQPDMPFAAMASRLHMTPVTLWRRLRAEGTSYSELRRSWLAKRAVQLLCRTDIGTEDLAEELGFSDARSMRHSLKTATGLTPSQIRRSRGLLDRYRLDQGALRDRIMERCDLLDA